MAKKSICFFSAMFQKLFSLDSKNAVTGRYGQDQGLLLEFYWKYLEFVYFTVD